MHLCLSSNSSLYGHNLKHASVHFSSCVSSVSILCFNTSLTLLSVRLAHIALKGSITAKVRLAYLISATNIKHGRQSANQVMMLRPLRKVSGVS